MKRIAAMLRTSGLLLSCVGCAQDGRKEPGAEKRPGSDRRGQARQHGKPVGAYEKRDHQQLHAVADGIHKDYKQPENPRMAAGMQRIPLERPTTNTRNHDTTASTAMTGANRSFKRKRISFSSVHLFCENRIQKYAPYCKDGGEQKSGGGLRAASRPRMG